MTEHPPEFQSARDEAVEREIAIGDRRAAYDGFVQVVSWLIGSLLLLNGAGLLAVIGQPVPSAKTALSLAGIFSFGLMAAFGAAGVAGHVALHLITRSDMRLGREASDKLASTVAWQRVTTLFCTALIASSFVAFSVGMNLGIWEASQRQTASVSEPQAQVVVPSNLEGQASGHAAPPRR
jgi:hypothetical protein